MVNVVYSITHWHVMGNKTRECAIVDLVVSCDGFKPEELVDIKPSRMHVNSIPPSPRFVLKDAPAEVSRRWSDRPVHR